MKRILSAAASLARRALPYVAPSLSAYTESPYTAPPKDRISVAQGKRAARKARNVRRHKAAVRRARA